MKKKRLLYKRALTLSFLVVLLVAFSVVFEKAHASDFIFKKIKIQMENNAQVDNNVHTYSNTGGNTTENNTGGNTTIQTGNAGSNTTICNQVNTNVINGKTVTTCLTGTIAPTPTSVPGGGGQPTTTPTPGGGGVVVTPTPTGGGGGAGAGGAGGGGGAAGAAGAAGGPSQAVLGASAMASTGTFMDNVMNAMAVLGAGFLALGIGRKLKKEGFHLQIELSY